MTLVLYLLMMLIMMKLNISPKKLVMSLTMVSIAMSIMAYTMTPSVFLMSAVIISFSSGMMILFSYCSMMCLHEEKNTTTTFLLILLLTPMAFYFWSPMTSNQLLQKMNMELMPTFYLLFMMLMVIISMLCMNKTFFNPNKKLMSSYLQEKSIFPFQLLS